MRKESIKIISGGQTGVDRAALDAAIELGIDYGGSVPKGKTAEKGIVPLKYDKQTVSLNRVNRYNFMMGI